MINTNHDIFWSNLVQKEYSEKLDEILDDINIFLKTTLILLKNNEKDFSSYHIFEEQILKKTERCDLDTIKKQKILEYFWGEYVVYEGISEIIYLKFRNFNRNFKKMYLKRDESLNKRLILHDCGLNNYLKYLDYAIQLKSWGIHSPDCKIITDAHDCGLEHDGLIFVTADEKMIEKIAVHDTTFLKIMEFKSCT